MEALAWTRFWEQVIDATRRTGCRRTAACCDCSLASDTGILLMGFISSLERDMWVREHILLSRHDVERIDTDENGIPQLRGMWTPATFGIGWNRPPGPPII